MGILVFHSLHDRAYIGVLLALAAAALSIASYYYLYGFLRKVIVEADVAGAVPLAVRVAVFLIANTVVYFLALWTTHMLAFRLETNLKKQGIRHLMNASFSFYDKNESGRIRKIIDDNTAMTHSSVAHLIPNLTTAVFAPLLGIPLAFYVDWRMGVLFTVSFLSGMLFIRKMMGDQNFMTQYMAASDKMNSGAVEYVRGIHVLKIFKTSVQSLKEFYQSVTEYAGLALQYSMSCRSWYVLFQVFLNAVFLVTLFFGYCPLSVSRYCRKMVSRLMAFTRETSIPESWMSAGIRSTPSGWCRMPSPGRIGSSIRILKAEFVQNYGIGCCENSSEHGQNVFLKSEYIFAFPFRFVQTAQNNNKKTPHIAQLGMYGGFGD